MVATEESNMVRLRIYAINYRESCVIRCHRDLLLRPRGSYPRPPFHSLARIVHHRSRHLQEGNGVSKRLRILRIEDVGERRGEGRREGIKLGGRRRLKEVSLAFEMP